MALPLAGRAHRTRAAGQILLRLAVERLLTTHRAKVIGLTLVRGPRGGRRRLDGHLAHGVSRHAQLSSVSIANCSPPRKRTRTPWPPRRASARAGHPRAGTAAPPRPESTRRYIQTPKRDSPSRCGSCDATDRSPPPPRADRRA